MATIKDRRLTSIHVRNIPVDTKAQFKAYCARRGYTMEAAVMALMRHAISADMPLPEASRTAPKKP